MKTLPFCRRCRSRDLFTTEQITMLNQYIQLPSADCMNASSTLSAIQLEQFLCLSYPALFMPLPYTHSRIHTMFVLFYLVFTAEFESICCAHVIVLVGWFLSILYWCEWKNCMQNRNKQLRQNKEWTKDWMRMREKWYKNIERQLSVFLLFILACCCFVLFILRGVHVPLSH